MENIDIKYSDIQTLMSEYRNNIGKNLNQFSTLMNDINALVGDKVDFAGQGAENIRNYYAQVHLTLLTGIMEAMQAMLSEVAVYKDGYDNIDGSEDFHYNENASEDLHTELEFQSAQMNTYHQEVRENLLNIADLFEGYEPSNESVQFNISETLNEMDRMSEEVESHESNTKKHLNDIKEVLVRLTSMISDANAYSANVVEYDGSLPFKMEDIMAFYNGYKKLDSRISETGDIMERVFKEEDKRLAAEQRKNQGFLEMAEAAMIIVVGGALCVASAGATTPLVAVGFATLGTTTAAFGIADAVEGTQDFYYGAGGDGSTRAVNPLRDTLFMENDDLYNICESVTVTAASVSLPVAAAGTATVKGFARSAFEYGVSGLAGQGSSYLAYKATGDKNIANIANIVGSTVVSGKLEKNEAIVRNYSDFTKEMSYKDAVRYVANSKKNFYDEFAKRATNLGMDDTKINKALKAIQNRKYNKMTKYLDLSSPNNAAVFWSGNKDAAAEYAKSIKGTIMEQTSGGKIFDNWRSLEGMYPDWDSKSTTAQKPIWEALSKTYAKKVEGKVTYVHPSGYIGNVWKNVEQPILRRKLIKGQITNIVEVRIK